MPGKTVYRSRLDKSIDHAVATAADASLFDHRALNGQVREIVVRDLVEPYLYPGMGTCTGIAVNSAGDQSKQLDIIVFDRRIVSPSLLRDGPAVVPCEAVLLVIEVKARIRNQDVQDAIANAVSVKELGLDPGVARRPDDLGSVPCALFAFNSDQAAPGLDTHLRGGRMACAGDGEWGRFQQVLASYNKTEEKLYRVPLSAVCVANRSFFRCIDARNVDDIQWDCWAWSDVARAEDHDVRDSIAMFVSWVLAAAYRTSEQRQTIDPAAYLLGPSRCR